MNISRQQVIWKREQQLTGTDIKQLTAKQLDGVDIVHLNGKLLVPNSLNQQVLNWYYIILVHPGVQRLPEILLQNAYWKGMKKDVVNYCKVCKKPKKECSNAQPKEAKETKWNTSQYGLAGSSYKQQEIGMSHYNNNQSCHLLVSSGRNKKNQLAQWTTNNYLTQMDQVKLEAMADLNSKECSRS